MTLLSLNRTQSVIDYPIAHFTDEQRTMFALPERIIVTERGGHND